MFKLLSLALLVSLASPGLWCSGDQTPVEGTAAGREVFDLLSAYYRDPEAITAIHERIQPNHDDAEVRTKSAEFLLRLFRQSLEDELTHRDDLSQRRPIETEAGWRTWTFGEEFSHARAVRRALFTPTPRATSEMLPVFRWLLIEDPDPEYNLRIARILVSRSTDATGSVLIEALEAPHPNAEVLSYVLKRVAEEQPSERVDQLANRLAHHHFAQVRQTARALSLSGPETLTNTDVLARLQSALPLIQDLDSMIRKRVPHSPSWGMAEVDDEWGSKVLTAGWIIEKNEDVARIQTMYGDSREIPVSDLDQTIQLSEIGNELSRIRSAYSSSIENNERRRLKGRLNNTGGFESPMSRWPVSLAELHVLAWSHRLGDNATVARLLLPTCDRYGDDRLLRARMAQKLAGLYESQMLQAFAGQRDYARAAGLAQHVQHPIFRFSCNQTRAQQLRDQLATRANDFQTLTLPTHDQWANLRNEISRHRQILYLCDRLRLLNMAQAGTPGGIEYSASQFSCTLQQGNKMGWKKLAPHEVLNPFLALFELDLEQRELEWVLPYLSNDDFILAYDRTRFGNHPRMLHRVSWVVSSLIDEVTGDRQSWFAGGGELRTSEGKAKYAKYIREKIERTPGIRYSDRLFQELATAPDWNTVHAIGSKILVIGQGDRFLTELMELGDRAGPKRSLIDLAWLLGRGEYAETIANWIPELESADAAYATCFVFRFAAAGSESHSSARSRLIGVLRGKLGLFYCDLVIEDILALKDATLHAAAIQCLVRNDGSGGVGFHTAQQLFNVGERAGLEFLVHHLQLVCETPPDPNCRAAYVVQSLQDWIGPTSQADSLTIEKLEAKVRKQFELATTGEDLLPIQTGQRWNGYGWVYNMPHYRWVKNW